MLMKETVTSIRRLFFLVGFYGVFASIGLGAAAILINPPDLPFAYAIIHLFWGVGFLYSSFKFHEFLQTSTSFVQYLLYTVGGYGVLSLLNQLIRNGFGFNLLEPISILMIVWYLILNVERLEEEHGFNEYRV